MSTPVLPRRPRRLGPRATAWFDRLLVLGLLALVLAAGVGSGQPSWLVLGVAQVAPLWWRRRHPAVVFGLVVVASASQVPITDLPLISQLAFPIAVYSVARFSVPAMAWVALAVGLIASTVAAFDWTAPYYDTTSLEAATGYLTTIAVIVIAAWALGTLGRTREAYVAALLDHADHLAHEAEQRAELAALDERTRIAREMHDVVAHGLSVIVVQADGARYAAAKDPAIVTSTLATVAATGRDALAEMRRLLGLLRSEETGVRPQPGLPDLVWLLDQAEADGLPLERDLPDRLPEVSDGLGLVVYRVVQEALTNIRRHAGAVREVRVRLAPEGGGTGLWLVEVEDDGRGGAADAPAASVAGGPTTGGLGLVGMRERVESSGGTLRTGPRPGGGFAVSARIPMDPAPSQQEQS